MSNRVILAALLLAAATGCAESGGQGANLRDKVYVSASVTEQGKPRALVEGTKVELRFTDDDRLIANAGCNQMQSPVSLDGGKLSVAELAITAMGCPKPEMHQQDEWLSKLLSAKPSWRLDGTNLVLAGSDTEIVLGVEAPVTLEGGTWVVDGIVTSEAVSSVPGGVRATFAFKDGRMHVDNGCNYAGGGRPYEVDGQKMTFETGPKTLIGCAPDVLTVENALDTALDKGEVTYKIDRNALTLTNASGAGLTLKKE